ncbi:hypothetical protein R3W88_021711 [Solanum pinnatisectum]|uniref:Neprosin PEP catalytic domain-containing protein n=1 Tax=Solanum pinnatisectum TaxID=50273 RepID=A0AAV9LSM2_9SOLN|nr:hypothetical protein R3W88_021711 [Solanum pinnatisectum]
MNSTLTRSKQNSSTTNWSSRIWFKGDGCPFGTVPIKQITKEDFIRQKNMPPLEDINNKSESRGRYISSQAYELAIVRIPKNPNNQFGGAGMAANIYNPHVKGQQHSACRMKIQKGSDILLGEIHVYKAGNKHCFNVLCPEFIIVNNVIPIDMAFDKISTRGGKTWELTMFIERVHFLYLILGRRHIMGSSFFLVGNSVSDGYCRARTVLNNKGATINVDKTTIYVDDTNLYQVLDDPQVGIGKFKHCAFFGTRR